MNDAWTERAVVLPGTVEDGIVGSPVEAVRMLTRPVDDGLNAELRAVVSRQQGRRVVEVAYHLLPLEDGESAPHRWLRWPSLEEVYEALTALGVERVVFLSTFMAPAPKLTPDMEALAVVLIEAVQPPKGITLVRGRGN